MDIIQAIIGNLLLMCIIICVFYGIGKLIYNVLTIPIMFIFVMIVSIVLTIIKFIDVIWSFINRNK